MFRFQERCKRDVILSNIGFHPPQRTTSSILSSRLDEFLPLREKGGEERQGGRAGLGYAEEKGGEREERKIAPHAKKRRRRRTAHFPSLAKEGVG